VPPHSVDVNGFCVVTLDCLIDLVCVQNACSKLFGESYEHDLANFLSYPSDITPSAYVSVLPGSVVRLDPIFATNKGTQDMEVTASFFCSQEAFCAREWCVIVQGLSDPKLIPGGFKEITVECTVPTDAVMNQNYYTQLVFQTKNGAKQTTFITIYVGESGLNVITEKTQDIFLGVFDYGFVCFGDLKPNCLFRVPGASPIAGFDSLNVAFFLLVVAGILSLAFQKKPLYGLLVLAALVWAITLIW